ncbi:MAG: hypothetical protein DRR42_25760 [Gammaproteobacteria bacterium]|nr:MAG: hypothetical protein DRR42_25760 [Gammaproteobacteria bacterium]
MRIITSLLILIVLFLFGGAGYQYLSEQSDSNGIPGQLYRVGGNTYHLLCEGQNGPTLLFESGRWGWYADWSPLWNLLPSAQRRCTYDRLGLGWSSHNSSLKHSDNVAMDLNKLLAVAGIDEPLIIVGHSLGGLYARKFYELFPERVSGLVLLDSTHEEGPKRLTYAPENLSEIKLCSLVAWTGTLRMFGTMEMLVPKNASPSLAQEVLSVANRSQFCSGLIMAAEGIESELKHGAPPKSLGNLPLVVVRRGKTADDYIGLDGDNREQFEKNEPIWYEMQEELAGLSSQSKLLIANRSGHQIQADAPETVIEAIDIVLAWVAEE